MLNVNVSNGTRVKTTMETDSFDNGHRVSTTEPSYSPHDGLDEKLDAELQAIVDERVSVEVANAVWEAVSRFAMETSQHRNPKVTLCAFCFAAGLYVNQGMSITELAESLGVTKQALSKRIVKFTEQLGLPPSRGMKSEKARESYRAAQLNKNT